jgi:type II secretory ATPase GspE/PulE/Tfp pilus assembly ATPase PilB-like protein
MEGELGTETRSKASKEGELPLGLLSLMRELQQATKLVDALSSFETRLLGILNSERFTIYQKGRSDREIISKFKSGEDKSTIRVPVNMSSIAGYVAMSQRGVLISDVLKPGSLEKIHPKLRFDNSFDLRTGFRTRSIIAVPIRYQNILLGVFQLINHRSGGSFTKTEYGYAEVVAHQLAEKFKHELQATKTPHEYLITKGIITEERLEEFRLRATKDNKTINDVLIKDGKIPKADLGLSLEHFYQVPFMEFDSEITPPMGAFNGMSEHYIKQLTWVPISQTDDEATILMEDPSNVSILMEIQRLISARHYVFKVGLLDDIRSYLTKSSGEQGRTATALVQKIRQEEAEKVLDVETIEESRDIAFDAGAEDEATVIKLVNQILFEGYERRASDIHIEPGKGNSPAVVRLRIDGVCQTLTEIPGSVVTPVVSRIKILSSLDISEKRKPQDGKFAVKMKGSIVELRVATLPTVNGESVVMRILATGTPLPFSKLNLTRRNYDVMKKLAEYPHGIILVVGPTGSGKTTTLHAVLGYLNTPDIKIWTAEDPVEITQPGLNQVQVQRKIGFDFSAALRAFLRADPDVMMIGEMRDYETAHSAVEASLTGHLVLSTLHTNSAPETITRLLDLGLDPASFSDALLGVLAQRLVRTLCEKCKEPYTPDLSEVQTIERFYGKEHFEELGVAAGVSTFYRTRGCKSCSDTGYRGRTGIHELLQVTNEMRALVYKKGSVHEIRSLAMKQGMRTLMQDGIAKLVAGMTDLENVRKIALGSS